MRRALSTLNRLADGHAPWKAAAGRAIALVLAAAAAWVLWREMQHLDLAQIRQAVAAWGPGRLTAAAGLMLASYGMLVAGELIALRWAGATVGPIAGAAASFAAYALSNNLGLGLLMGGALRISAYTRFGVTLIQIAQITAYNACTFALGVCILGGASLIQAPAGAYSALGLAPAIARLAGWLMLAAPVAYVVACAALPNRLRLFGLELRTVAPRLAIAQIGFGLADSALSAALFWLLLGEAAPHYATLLGAYLVSVVGGLVSGVPGGVGVFETLMLTLLPGVDRAALVAAFLGYRLFYYLIPLALAVPVLLVRRPAASATQART